MLLLLSSTKRKKMGYVVIVLFLFSASAFSQAQLVNNQNFPLLLLNTLKQNPALIQKIRGNPTLLAALQASLQKSASLGGYTNEPQNTCESIRKQNVRLKQMIKAVMEGNDLEEALLKANSPGFQNYLSQALERRQRELGSSNQLENELQITKTSLESLLVTPTPSWSTTVMTSSFPTEVTQTVSTEVPIILRGNKVITTIFEETSLEVMATEVVTSSTFVTPTPTWSTVTITMTESAKLPVVKKDVHILASPSEPYDHRTGLEHADIIRLGKKPSRTPAKTRLDRLKEAYGAFFANSAQRSAQKYGHVFPGRSPSPKNPIFQDSRNVGDIYGDYPDYELSYDFDQQVLAAQASPVSVKEPSSPKPTSQVLTLYFSGKVPGEYTTSLSTIMVEPDEAQGRSRRDISSISPSKVQPIEMTKAPSSSPHDVELIVDDFFKNLENIALEDSLQSSISVVTVTKTVTVTYSHTSCLK